MLLKEFVKAKHALKIHKMYGVISGIKMCSFLHAIWKYFNNAEIAITLMLWQVLQISYKAFLHDLLTSSNHLMAMKASWHLDLLFFHNHSISFFVYLCLILNAVHSCKKDFDAIDNTHASILTDSFTKTRLTKLKPNTKLHVYFISNMF